MPAASGESKLADAPRLSEDLIALFLNQSDRKAQAYPGPERRKHKRFSHRVEGGLRVEFSQPDGQSVTCTVHPRNVSSGGIGFMFEAYVHPDTRCTVVLQTADHGTAEVPGRVVGCRHVNGRLHEIGVAFDEPIDPAETGAVPAGADKPT